MRAEDRPHAIDMMIRPFTWDDGLIDGICPLPVIGQTTETASLVADCDTRSAGRQRVRRG